MLLKWATNSGRAKAPISVCGCISTASLMRAAATVASFRSSILPILLGAMKAAAAISTQSSSSPAQIQFLLSDANADMWNCQFHQYTNDQLGRCAVKNGVSSVLNKGMQIARPLVMLAWDSLERKRG